MTLIIPRAMDKASRELFSISQINHAMRCAWVCTVHMVSGGDADCQEHGGWPELRSISGTRSFGWRIYWSAPELSPVAIPWSTLEQVWEGVLCCTLYRVRHRFKTNKVLVTSASLHGSMDHGRNRLIISNQYPPITWLLSAFLLVLGYALSEQDFKRQQIRKISNRWKSSLWDVCG